MSRIVGLTIAAVLLAASLFAQAPNPSSSPLEGAWRVAEVVVTGANASTNSNPQPSLYIFTKRHYSILSVNSTQPRPKFEPLKTPGKPTDAEKIARYQQWNPFTANSGTYEIKGTLVTTRPLVAKNETVMSGSGDTWEFKIEGDTLWLLDYETSMRLVRVE